MDSNYYNYWASGRKTDIKLSMEDYIEVIEVLRDDNLSGKTKFKFKNLWEINASSLMYVPVFCSPFAYMFSKFITGPADRALANWKFNMLIMSFTLPCMCWKLYTVPVPRRLYTEILTDQTEDGQYIRETIREQKPGLWKFISM